MPQRLSAHKARLPRQDVIRDASTSGVAETSERDVLLACAATRSRGSRRSDGTNNTAAATERSKK